MSIRVKKGDVVFTKLSTFDFNKGANPLKGSKKAIILNVLPESGRAFVEFVDNGTRLNVPLKAIVCFAKKPVEYTTNDLATKFNSK